MRIEVNLKNGNNYIFKNVTSHSELTFGPIWFWVEWGNRGNRSRRYIATSEIQDILLMDDDVIGKEENK